MVDDTKCLLYIFFYSSRGFDEKEHYALRSHPLDEYKDIRRGGRARNPVALLENNLNNYRSGFFIGDAKQLLSTLLLSKLPRDERQCRGSLIFLKDLHGSCLGLGCPLYRGLE